MLHVEQLWPELPASSVWDMPLETTESIIAFVPAVLRGNKWHRKNMQIRCIRQQELNNNRAVSEPVGRWMEYIHNIQWRKGRKGRKRHWYVLFWASSSQKINPSNRQLRLGLCDAQSASMFRRKRQKSGGYKSVPGINVPRLNTYI